MAITRYASAEVETMLRRGLPADYIINKASCGYSVATPFSDADGDAMGFYIVGPSTKGLYTIEDDGLLLATLGLSPTCPPAQHSSEALAMLLQTFELHTRKDTGDLATAPVVAPMLVATSLRFAEFALYVQEIVKIQRSELGSSLIQ